VSAVTVRASDTIRSIPEHSSTNTDIALFPVLSENSDGVSFVHGAGFLRALDFSILLFPLLTLELIRGTVGACSAGRVSN
jgi:hypothetical protein